MALEALGAAVDERLDVVGVIGPVRGNRDQHGVYPSSCFDAVKPADNKLELLVEALVEVLDAIIVRGDLHALDPLLDKPCSHFCLVLPDVRLPEQELAVEVGYINCV